jgi:hypothetical protein
MRFSAPEGLFYSMKTKVIRQVPEGMCKRCAGTGNGEETADLGEAHWHAAEFPIRTCNSCRGTGMTIAKTEITGLGRILLLVIFAALWTFPAQVRLVVVLSIASIVIFDAVYGRRQTREEKAGSSEDKQTVGQIAPRAEPAGPATEGVLSLNAAIESHRQTPDRVESKLTEGELRK